MSNCYFADNVPRVSGPAEEHDIFVRPRHLPDVRRQDGRVPYLPQTCRETNPRLLNLAT